MANKHSLENQALAKIVKEEEDSLNDENNKVIFIFKIDFVSGFLFSSSTFFHLSQHKTKKKHTHTKVYSYMFNFGWNG